MGQNNMVGMILAGGRGSRLYELTNKVAKPAVYYGAKYRIIDFPLSNCANSGVSNVGVLTQYESVLLNSYVAQGAKWGLDSKDSGVYVLPPREKNEGFGIYRGTADSISQNIDFLDALDPDHVLILSGDHIYKMNYAKMLEAHKKAGSDVTIAVIEVPFEEASRFGIMNCDENDRIIDFEEKPKNPKSNLASMGIYIFNWDLLRRTLIMDAKNPKSTHDFGHDIIPCFLKGGKKLGAYRFKGYWKDVGTIDSLWEANMDILNAHHELDLLAQDWKIYTEDTSSAPQFISKDAVVNHACINQGCVIEGTVESSVLFTDVEVEEDAIVKDAVLMPEVTVKKGARVTRAIVAQGVVIEENAVVGNKNSKTILLVSENVSRGETYE